MSDAQNTTTNDQDWEDAPELDLEDCLDCENPFCSGGRCIEQLHAEARRREAMWKEVGP